VKKTLITIALLGAAGGAVWYFAAPHSDPERIAAWLRTVAGRWWTMPVFFALYALLAVLFVPPQVLSIAAVVLWGWQKGGAIELAAATLGAMLPYALARGAMRERVERALARHPLGARLLREEAASLLLILRLFPIVPYNALNYIAGLSPVRPLRYAAISLFGMVPSTFIFAYFVDVLMQGAAAPREVAGRIFLAGALLALLVVAARFVARRLRRTAPAPPV
jgi:uncharacterized membrane protein YdjX (TVP38/TMEM64 family)